MQEYIRLGHMELVPAAQINRPGAYLPHHGVFRADNPDKIRVVFNASHKAMNGISLNDTLLPGPKLQADITVVVSNWRYFKVAGTTDVEKMYRQILVHRDNVDCFKAIQAHHFKEEIKALKDKKPISRRSHLARLAPMFGRDDLLRVGGRLQNAQLSYDETHPIILPGECIIVRRLIEYEHREETMHGGAQLMRSQLARQFWITRGERIVQSVCRVCIKCTRYRAVTMEQQMAPLPAVRVTPARAFKSIGLDYAGPVPVLFLRAKKASSSKGYVAIFVCLVTRAVHIEIVSDFTADAFLAAVKGALRSSSRTTVPRSEVRHESSKSCSTKVQHSPSE
ncbi:unnamed protein product [Trichogramma brassicae]|uniref:Integrase zinc-binding domain-containing protein n=1 Tax=Trichogramma brassicae TaxID=86971 RepID=A0A6H5ITQ9_9HYME|nr:unnamed protein product [Trichogramma brassicae]